MKIPEYIEHPEYLEQGLRAVTDISGEWACYWDQGWALIPGQLSSQNYPLSKAPPPSLSPSQTKVGEEAVRILGQPI